MTATVAALIVVFLAGFGAGVFAAAAYIHIFGRWNHG